MQIVMALSGARLTVPSPAREAIGCSPDLAIMDFIPAQAIASALILQIRASSSARGVMGGVTTKIASCRWQHFDIDLIGSLVLTLNLVFELISEEAWRFDAGQRSRHFNSLLFSIVCERGALLRCE